MQFPQPADSRVTLDRVPESIKAVIGPFGGRPGEREYRER